MLLLILTAITNDWRLSFRHQTSNMAWTSDASIRVRSSWVA